MSIAILSLPFLIEEQVVCVRFEENLRALSSPVRCTPCSLCMSFLFSVARIAQETSMRVSHGPLHFYCSKAGFVQSSTVNGRSNVGPTSFHACPCNVPSSRDGVVRLVCHPPRHSAALGLLVTIPHHQSSFYSFLRFRLFEPT